MLASTLNLLLDPQAWLGDTGFLQRILQHLWISVLALVPAAALGVGIGAVIGHTGVGRGLAVGSTGAMRAIPSLGLLTALALLVPGGVSQAWIPSTIALVVLAVPPILAGTYAGIEAIGKDVTDAARAIGHTEFQIFARVEMPLAGPSVMDGLRSATLQVIATATICAYLGTGGLGRPLLDGLATQNYPEVLAGAVIVIALVVVVEAVLTGVGRLCQPRGLGR